MMKIMLFLMSLIFLINKKYYYIYNLIFFSLLFLLIEFNYKLMWLNLYNFIMNDFISYNLSILTIYIISMMIMYYKMINELNKYLFMIIWLLNTLILVFNTMNYFLFYLLFEISLIPTFFLIMGWGYQSERIQASMYMLMYTLFASLPLLIIIFLINKINYSMNFWFMNKFFFSNFPFFMYLLMLLAFLIKLPMYFTHLWLPKAHVEAPVTGSMILAGVMLKLGGYGIIRAMNLMLNLCKFFNFLLISLSLLGLMNLSLTCLRQNDLKSLVAYSSIVHMMLMLIGLMSMKYTGMIGGMIMMISHGLCSSGLFFLVNLNYLKLKTRNFFMIKGMILITPILSLMWFLFCAMNMACPPSLNLLSELMISNIILNISILMIPYLILIMLLSMMYSLYLSSYSQHSKFFDNYKNFNNININNLNNLLFHWLPMNLLIIKNLFY